MEQYRSEVATEVHERLAKTLFNTVWDLMEKPDRSPAEDERMVHAAHASRLHWGVAGTALQWARGEWQLARVSTRLARLEPALHHANRCLELVEGHDLGAFDLGLAYEALGRIHALAGRSGDQTQCLAAAREAAGRVADREDRAWLLKTLRTFLGPNRVGGQGSDPGTSVFASPPAWPDDERDGQGDLGQTVPGLAVGMAAELAKVDDPGVGTLHGPPRAQGMRALSVGKGLRPGGSAAAGLVLRCGDIVQAALHEALKPGRGIIAAAQPPGFDFTGSPGSSKAVAVGLRGRRGACFGARGGAEAGQSVARGPRAQGRARALGTDDG